MQYQTYGDLLIALGYLAYAKVELVSASTAVLIFLG